MSTRKSTSFSAKELWVLAEGMSRMGGVAPPVATPGSAIMGITDRDRQRTALGLLDRVRDMLVRAGELPP